MLARSSQHHQQILAANVNALNPAYRQMMAGATGALMAGGASHSQALAQAHGILYGIVQRQAAMLAFVDNFRLLGIGALVIIPLMFLMKKITPQKGAMVSH